MRRYRDFYDFQDGGSRHLEFSKIWNFNDQSAVGANVRHRATFHQNRSHSCRDGNLTFFFKMAAVRYLGFVGRLLGGHDDHLVVSMTTPNLVKIDAVVSITWNFQYFARLAWKRLFMPPKLGFWGYFDPQVGNNINETRKRQIIARVRVVCAIKRENPSTGLTCRWVPIKKV